MKEVKKVNMVLSPMEMQIIHKEMKIREENIHIQKKSLIRKKKISIPNIAQKEMTEVLTKEMVVIGKEISIIETGKVARN